MCKTLTSKISIKLPEEVGVYLNAVLNWHGDKLNQLAAEAIDPTNVSYTKHHQLLILVDV